MDTCVIAEILRPRPSIKVTKWIIKEDENNFYISVVTIDELHKGIEKLDEPRRKELHNWVENDLKDRFSTRIMDIDLQTAVVWGKIQGMKVRIGKPMPAIDAFIAATDIAHHLTVVSLQHFRHERQWRCTA